MKYEAGNIVLLNNEKTVYISSVDEENQKYYVFNTDDDNAKMYTIKESAIFMLVT